MLTKIMTWVSIAALLLAVLRLPTASYRVLLEFVVCLSALLVVSQGVRSGKYLWAAGFAAIAVLFNPILPVALSRKTLLWLDSFCVMAFLISSAVFKDLRRPRLSIPLIADRAPGSESL